MRNIVFRNSLISEHRAGQLLRSWKNQLRGKLSPKRRKEVNGLLNDMRKALKTVGPYERDGVFTVEEVMALVGTGHGHVNRRPISYDTKRLKVFKRTGTVCVACGLPASHFALERCWEQDGDLWHFNLYGLRDGKEILFTRDHIKPLARGGTDCLDNQETMCCTCNFKKGDKWEE